ncbi:MAG: D-Ala-D-Ala carboxypeptidase family metallohydrolase [Hyphomicrobiaceae bacterium]
MSKRMRSAWITVAVLAASAATIGAAEARSSHRSHGSSGTSRSCLTSAARGILNRIEQRFGAMQIISTCRPGARIAGTGRISRHASGNAIDFNAGGRKGAVIQWLIANHHSGGTMTYADMSHIHVDIGQHFVSLAGHRTRVASRGKWSSNRMSLGRTQSRSSRRHAESSDEGSEQRSERRSGTRHRRADGPREGSRGISEPAA